MPRASFQDSLHFLGTFIRSPATVGALLPSSRYLAQVLVEDLLLGPDDVVVEYGPGTGPITQVLAPMLAAAGARYLGIEREPGFCARLRVRFPQLDFHQGSVEQVARVLEERGLARPRVIVSGLPFASLPDRVQKRVIIATRRVLAPGGEFRTFQYVHAYGLPAAQRFRRAMREKFSSFERSAPVLRNVPPAYVLRYRL